MDKCPPFYPVIVSYRLLFHLLFPISLFLGITVIVVASTLAMDLKLQDLDPVLIVNDLLSIHPS